MVEKVKDLSTSNLMKVLIDNKRSIIYFLVVASILGLVFVIVKPPKYTSESIIRVRKVDSANNTEAVSEQAINSYVETLRLENILGKELKVTVTVPKGSGLMKIDVTGNDENRVLEGNKAIRDRLIDSESKYLDNNINVVEKSVKVAQENLNKRRQEGNFPIGVRTAEEEIYFKELEHLNKLYESRDLLNENVQIISDVKILDQPKVLYNILIVVVCMIIGVMVGVCYVLMRYILR